MAESVQKHFLNAKLYPAPQASPKRSYLAPTALRPKSLNIIAPQTLGENLFSFGRFLANPLEPDVRAYRSIGCSGRKPDKRQCSEQNPLFSPPRMSAVWTEYQFDGCRRSFDGVFGHGSVSPQSLCEVKRHLGPSNSDGGSWYPEQNHFGRLKVIDTLQPDRLAKSLRFWCGLLGFHGHVGAESKLFCQFDGLARRMKSKRIFCSPVCCAAPTGCGKTGASAEWIMWSPAHRFCAVRFPCLEWSCRTGPRVRRPPPASW